MSACFQNSCVCSAACCHGSTGPALQADTAAPMVVTQGWLLLHPDWVGVRRQEQ
jgi:hypothetical protein